jgi:hypothetical protein
MRKGATLAAIVGLMGLFTLAGCGEQTPEEKMQDAAEDAGDAAEDAGDAMKEGLEGK